MSGFDYVGAGNSTNKKDAQGNAAKDYVNYLVRTGHVNQNDVPQESGSQHHNKMQDNATPLISTSVAKPVFQEGMGPNEIGQAYRPYNEHGQNNYTYIDRLADSKKVEEAEDVDVNSSIHGNWTIENAKSKLHQFLQTHHINADYKYTSVGPDHIRYEVSQWSFFLEHCITRILVHLSALFKSSMLFHLKLNKAILEYICFLIQTGAKE